MFAQYLDFLGELAGLQCDVRAAFRGDFDFDAGDEAGLKALLFYGDTVVPDGKFGGGIAAVLGGSEGAGKAGVDVLDRDRGSRHRAARRIGDCTQNDAAEGLGRGASGNDNQQRNQTTDQNAQVTDGPVHRELLRIFKYHLDPLEIRDASPEKRLGHQDMDLEQDTHLGGDNQGIAYQIFAFIGCVAPLHQRAKPRPPG